MGRRAFIALGIFLSLAVWQVEASGCAELARHLVSGSQAGKSIADLKAEHAHFLPTTSLENQEFRKKANTLPKGNHSVFTVEHAYLKQLNERVFSDREITQATTNIFKRLFLAQLENAPKANLHVVAKYSDYKGIRLIFNNDSPVIEKEIQTALDKAAIQFSKALKEYPEITKKLEAKDGVLSDPIHWFHSGFGRTHDAAAARARMARFEDLPMGRAPPAGRFEERESMQNFLERVADTENLRKQIEKSIPKKSGILEAIEKNGKNQVLSQTAIAILADANRELSNTQTEGWQNYTDFVDRKFRERFNTPLTHSQIRLLQSYYHSLHVLSPSLYLRDPVTVDLTEAPDGVIWVDVAGQNSRNLSILSRALYQASKINADDREKTALAILKLTRKGQNASSLQFEHRLGRFETAVRHAGLIGDSSFSLQNGIKFSGDEGAFAASRPLSSSDFSRVVAELARLSSKSKGGEAFDYRLIYLDSIYTSAGTRIPKEDKSVFMKKAESLEKTLRAELLRERVPAEKLKDLLFGIELRPVNHNATDVDLVIGGKVDDLLTGKIGRIFHKVTQEMQWTPVGVRPASL